jgi:hypothetical protein
LAARAPSLSRAKRIGGGPRGGGSFRGGSFRGGESFHGSGSFRRGSFRSGGFRGGNLSRLGGSVRAGREDFRAIDPAGLRHAEPLVCEPAPAQGVPGCGLLSGRYGEGAAAQGLELISQAIGLFEVFHCYGFGFGGCHCCLGRRRLGVLLHGLGVFAGEGASRNFLIEWPVVLPCLMATSSLEIVLAS